jgi:drug/metabolite transporter (DMT)-like permease
VHLAQQRLGLPDAVLQQLGAGDLAGVVAAGVAFAFAEGFSGNAPAGPRQWLGDALGLAAALLWGGTTLVVRASRLALAGMVLGQLELCLDLLGLSAPERM